MRTIITLCFTFLLSIVSIAQVNHSENILAFKVTGISYIAHLKNGEKIYGDTTPINDGREVIFDFNNNTINCQKYIHSPFKIVKQFKSQQITLTDSEVFEVIGNDNKPATLQLVLFNDMAILYLRQNERPGLVHSYHLAYK